MTERSFALIQSTDQWRRTAHQNTALISGMVQLYWHPDERDVNAPEQVAPWAVGLAFDPGCRLYHSVPQHGQVERVMWASSEARPQAVNLFAEPLAQPVGDFHPVAAEPPLAEPGALAVTDNGRLFVGETTAARVLVYDLFERRLLQRVPLPPGARPLDMATDGRLVFVLVDVAPFLFLLDAHSAAQPDDSAALIVAAAGTPSRLAMHPVSGQLYLLANAGLASARMIPLARPDEGLALPFATDLEFMPDGNEPDSACLLVAARGIGQDFARYAIGVGQAEQVGDLKARGYDGRGIVRTPDGRIGYWTGVGFRHAVAARVRYLSSGRVTSFRLDSGRFQTNWGRLFLDACIPQETDVRVHCVAADEPPEEATLLRTPPANTLQLTIHRPDLSPPTPALSLLPKDDAAGQRLHARRTGRELPWSQRATNDPFRTYEAPVIANAGRYLWVTVEMSGNSRFTPRVKSLRIEYPSHDLLRRLPRMFSRGDHVDFLRRYLAVFDGTISDLELRAMHRRVLLDPTSAPPEVLPWLGGFVGMLVDERFSTAAKRLLVAEAVSLFQMRGTIRGLRRLLEIYLDITPIIVEHYRARGLGGAFVGGEGDTTSRAVLGAGFRVGGKIGEVQESSVQESSVQEAGIALQNVEDAFQLHAHRFSVIVPAALSAEQTSAVNDLLELHRPAHTIVDVCSVDAGIRVGLGLYAELTSLVGHSSGFGAVRAGHWLLGRRDVLGRPGPAGRVGISGLGYNSVSG